MIEILEFNERPIQPGQTRNLVLRGDAPFTLRNSCFVNCPPPPGFRECDACNVSLQIGANEVYAIQCDPNLWLNRSGQIVVHITDAIGMCRTLKVEVVNQ